uniref:Transmembrane protein n=1 Tax=Timema poppense TaxID=170557 RepID=A0A7R9DUN3_TIMPO|nr:unnamed protein product [Timema poppensis]
MNRTCSRGYCNMTAQEILQDEPQDLLLDRVATVLDTHVLRFKIPQDGQDHVTQSAKSRIRRHHRHMFPLMVVGFMTMAAFLVPLGFQFMAMLGGKALLLSKIALMMSSFQGLKKVAASGINYGWYQVPPYDPYHHGHLHYHDRSYQENRRAMEVRIVRIQYQTSMNPQRQDKLL